MRIEDKVASVGLVVVILLLLVAVFAIPTEGQQRGERLGTDAREDVILINYQRIDPLYVHQGIWMDVAVCLGEYENIQGWEEIEWGVADDIIGWYAPDQSWLYSYGVTQFGYDHETSERTTWRIVLEAEYWLHSTVIAHEANHGILPNVLGEPTSCLMDSPESDAFGERRVPVSVLERLGLS